jgi:hypothetical protein
MFFLLAFGVTFDVAPQCLSNGNVTACGYQCTATRKGVACAKTPEGLCAHGVCWDPAPDVRWLLANDDDVERPTCVVSLREAACGFHCLKQVDGRVRCSQTPEGACHANQEAIACWDPPEAVRWRMLQRRDVQNAECISFLDHIECGYHCTAVGTTMRCAISPDGSCATHFTQVACFDPPYDDVVPTAGP